MCKQNCEFYKRCANDLRDGCIRFGPCCLLKPLRLLVIAYTHIMTWAKYMGSCFLHCITYDALIANYIIKLTSCTLIHIKTHPCVDNQTLFLYDSLHSLSYISSQVEWVINK